MKENEKKNNNIGMKVLSVVIATLIWLLVANTNDPVITKRFSDVPVTIENENALTASGYAYEITEGEEASFTIKGKKSIVSGMTESDFNVVADFSKLSLTDAVPIDVTSKKYGDQIEITMGTTNTMKIKTDQITSISLPVNVHVSGTVSDGYYVGTTTTTPNLVRVTGPENLLSDAKEIRAEVNVSGIDKDVTTSTKPILCDKDGEVIESSQINMDADSIDVSISLWKTKKVSINLTYEGTPSDGYAVSSFDYEPKTVTVAANDDIYDDLDSLDLNPVSLEGKNSDYQDDIDIDSSTFPDGVILAEDNFSLKITAKIEKIISKKLTFSKKDITVKHKGDYKIAYDDDNEYFINIEGAKTLVNAIKISDFSPWIDLSELDEGEHEVTIHVKEKDGISVDSTSKVRITLSK